MAVTPDASAEVWLIANPVAGGGRAARYAGVATRALLDAGVPCRLAHPASAEQTQSTAADAVAAGARAVIACGGDGTVHAVLQSLVDTDIPLGILAGGSGDDVAAGLGITVGDAHAVSAALVRVVAADAPDWVDVGEAVTSDGTRRYFLGVMSTGFDSSVNERANAMSRLAGQRYNVAMLRELASFQPLDYDVDIDGVRIEATGMLVSVGNGPRFGGGMLVCPGAVMDDGLLDVTWLGPLSKGAFLRVFPSVYKGTHVRHPAVQTYRGTRLSIAAAGQVAYADGERIGPLPVTVTARPHGVRVLRG